MRSHGKYLGMEEKGGDSELFNLLNFLKSWRAKNQMSNSFVPEWTLWVPTTCWIYSSLFLITYYTVCKEISINMCDWIVLMKIYHLKFPLKQKDCHHKDPNIFVILKLPWLKSSVFWSMKAFVIISYESLRCKQTFLFLM